MKVIFLGLVLLIVSSSQAMANRDEDFNMNFTSKEGSIIHSNEQAHELNGTIYLSKKKI